MPGSTATVIAPAAATLPALAPGSPLPAGRHPAAVYLAGLAEGPGRASMRSTLVRIAASLGFGLAECPWQDLRHAHVAALRARWQAGFAPATANKYLSALRGVLRQAWLLGLMTGEEYQRAAAVRNVPGSRRPAGRALEAGELRALFAACADGTAAGARDAAAFALMFGCGLRRVEAVAARIEDYDADTGQLRIVGKGNRERTVYAVNGAAAALAAWCAVRGDAPGAILAPVTKAGAIGAGRGLTAQALMMRLKRRARQAAIGECTPHDLRRTFVSSALEHGADLAMVQALAGHASPTTTAQYDRRPEEAKRQAARLVHVPYAGPAKLRQADPGGLVSTRRQDHTGNPERVT